MTAPAGGSPGLRESVRAVLQRAVDTYRDSPDALRWLRHHLDRYDEPLRLAIAGKVKAGKSTLLNALVGEEIAPTDAGECTKVVTWYQDGHDPDRDAVPPHAGQPRQLRIDRDERRPAHRHGRARGHGGPAGGHLAVDSLRSTSLIDTPGIASLSLDVSARSERFLAPEDAPTAADAVLYLMRHLHSADMRFLESFHDKGVARAAPVNTIAVLSRADEVGVGRARRMRSARRIAARYRTDETLRAFCQTVVPVAGLLAVTGRTMRQDEYAALAALAKLPAEQLDALLLTVDRFVATDGGDAVADLSAATRTALLDRFGLFGVRLSTTLIRQGVGDAATLRVGTGAAQRARRAARGPGEPVHGAPGRAQGALGPHRTRRGTAPRPATGGDSARRRGRADPRRCARVRRAAAAVRPAWAGAATAEGTGAGGGTPDRRRRQRPNQRLGLPPDAGRDELRAVALDRLTAWRRRVESPMSSRVMVNAARVVVRSCEGILAGLG